MRIQLQRNIHYSVTSELHFRIAALCMLLICGSIRAQLLNSAPETPEPRFGIVLGLGGNFSFTEIQEFAGSELCGVFRNGSRVGYGFGLEAELPIGLISIIPSVHYRDLSSTFRTTPFVLEHAFDVAAGSLVTIERQRTYEANISGVTFETRAGLRPWQHVRFDLGFGLGVFSSHSYTTREQLLTANAVYSDNSLSAKELRSGPLEVHPIQLMAIGGAQYDIRISPAMVVSPRVSFQIPLTSIMGSGSSSYMTVAALGGLSLMYQSQSGIAGPESIPDLVVPPIVAEQKVTPTRSALALQVRAVGLTENGEEIPEPVVAIENVRVTDISPTLNYIFFDDGKGIIPDRYNQFSTATEAKTFDPTSLFSLNAQGIHYDVLNIIGSRLRADQKARITLTGTRSGHSLDSLAEEIALSRATNVARYLQDVWGISSSRIRIRSRGIPEKASDETTPNGQAENRRVEITATPSTILGPIETKKLERTATPPRMVFDPVITSEAGVKSFTITIKHGARILEHIDALSEGSQQRWLWNIPAENLIAQGDSVIWVAEVVDSADNVATLTGTIRIRKSEDFKDITKLDTTADKSLERFNLLLFDYSATSSTNEQAYMSLLDRVAHSVTLDARISLIGHTDVTGDPSFNDRLSLDRASKASFLLSSRLRELGIRAPQLSLEGHGARDVLFDNSQAEGRMLSRTVRIFIERDLRK
jgi:outer membrane protein OmpA-like peptidoglycan-associated protein